MAELQSKADNSLLYGRENIIAMIAVTLTIIFAWVGILDQPVEFYLDQSILNAAGIYAVARGINALVSVLQSVDLSVVILTVSPGEVLDPINDMIERFSEVMTYALASLATQKILIVLAQQKIFSALITISGLAYLYFRVFHAKYRDLAFKTFLTLVFVRFSLALVMMLNLAVDGYFIDAQIKQEQEQVSSMKGELITVQQLVVGQEAVDKQQVSGKKSIDDNVIESLQSKITTLDTELNNLSQQIQEQNQKIIEQEGRLTSLQPEKTLTDKVKTLFSNKKDSNEIVKAEKAKGDMESKLTLLQNKKEKAGDLMNSSREELECAQLHQDGKDCSLWESMTKKYYEPFSSKYEESHGSIGKL